MNSLEQARLARELERQRALQAAIKAETAVADAYFWLTECTRTVDEQDRSSKPFPKRPYIQPLLQVLDKEDTIIVGKSRTMMGTWTVCGWVAHQMFTHPLTTAVFQSDDEERAVNCVTMVKTLWSNSMAELKAKWPVAKDPRDQAREYFELSNGSWCWGIVGKNIDKLRSLHPTIYVQDESAIIRKGRESWAVAGGARTPKMIAVSSMKRGWFADIVNCSTPVDWPEYGPAVKAA